MNLKDKKILLVGAASTTEAMIPFFLQRGALITVTDIKSANQLSSIKERFANQKISWEFGGFQEKSFFEADLIVPSPGVPLEVHPLAAAIKKSKTVLGDIELVSRHLKSSLVAVTGTNGKSTVVSLIGRLCQDYGLKTFVGGNIGRPLVNCLVPEPKDEKNPGYMQDDLYQVVVAEVSSFQMETVDSFRPHVGVLLNISPDHLDRHGSMEHYASLKGKLFARQNVSDWAVINWDDRWCREIAEKIDSPLLRYGRQTGVEARIEGERIIVQMPGQKTEKYCIDNPVLANSHNLENSAAAILTARALGLDQETIKASVTAFQGLPHRLEKVGTWRGITFVNDSKATNVDAAKRAISTFTGPLAVIMGGREKGADFISLKNLFGEKTYLLTIGEAAGNIEQELESVTRIFSCGTMERAVKKGIEILTNGGTLLLAPGCASFDQYKSYQHRGEHFGQLVARETCGFGL